MPIGQSSGDKRRGALKQRWPNRNGEVIPVILLIYRPHSGLDDHSSKQKNWNQDEANGNKAMMICRMSSKQ